MKITFDVTNLFEMTNSVTNESFVKLQLVKITIKEINKCKTEARTVAYHSVPSTELVVGDKFIYDDVNYEMFNQQYVGKDGLAKTQKVIYLKTVGE